MRGFGPLEFQLMLLRRMADYQPGLVEDAVRGLGQPRLAVRDANRRWQAMVRSRTFPGGLARLRLVLGPPEVLLPTEFGDLSSEVAWWRLPLWPDLRYEAIAVPGGPVLQEWLVRPDGATGPRLAVAADARPWTCVVSDVDEGFGPARHEDGDAPSRWSVEFTARDGAGRRRRHLARFTWGLLQTVTELDEPELDEPEPGGHEPPGSGFAQRGAAS
jgi:hypothetical protein